MCLALHEPIYFAFFQIQTPPLSMHHKWKESIELKDDSLMHKAFKAICYANALCQLDGNENEH